MTKDLIERLTMRTIRGETVWEAAPGTYRAAPDPLCTEAATELTRLAQDNVRQARALRRAEGAMRNMLTGISVHNAMNPDAPARRDNIEGAVVDALADAHHAVRTALTPEAPADTGGGA